MNILKLTPFDSTITLVLGQQCQYICSQHPSIGLTNDFKIDDLDILELIEAQVTLAATHIPPRPGGDKGTKTYIFEAKNRGTTTLTINTYNRGELTRSHIIELKVQ